MSTPEADRETIRIVGLVEGIFDLKLETHLKAVRVTLDERDKRIMETVVTMFAKVDESWGAQLKTVMDASAALDKGRAENFAAIQDHCARILAVAEEAIMALKVKLA